MIKFLQIFFSGIISALIIIVCYAQMIRPLIKNTPVFPFFRRRQNLEKEFELVNEEISDKETREKLEERRKELQK